jgi:hypothetical protein
MHSPYSVKMVDTVSNHVKWQLRNAHSVDGTEQHHADQIFTPSLGT